jgi:hypothetical protein
VSFIDPYDPRAEREAAAERERRAKLSALTEEADWRWLMGNERGRRVVRRLLETTGVWRSSFTGNSETFFREGARNVGLQVLNLVTTHAPEQLIPTMTETLSVD